MADTIVTITVRLLFPAVLMIPALGLALMESKRLLVQKGGEAAMWAGTALTCLMFIALFIAKTIQ
jgi:hypothetical protein